MAHANLNPLLSWLWELLQFFSVEQIPVPTDFHEQVAQIRILLRSDTSGLVNSLLDFAIDAALVDYSVETDNTNLTKVLNSWLGNINQTLRGKIPTGVNALAKEYYRERWKGSSLLVLRTVWEDVNGFTLPTKLWFVSGENIYIKDKERDNRIIGTEDYYLKVGDIDKRQEKILPSRKNEKIFVQKPFSSWNELYPIPFIIQRGIYKNLKLFNLMNTKGERIVGRAIEYMLGMKKGTEALALSGNPDFIYSEEDLNKIKDKMKTFISDSRTNTGTPTHISNFDTEMEHLIPDYSKALNESLYVPMERRLLAGLGLVEIVEGVASTRREGILNPKPFVAEVKAGVSDFTTLLYDILKTIIAENTTHKKYFGNDMKIRASVIDDFIDDSIRNHLRSMYDRGTISKQTYDEIVGSGYVDFDVEVKRRKSEYKEGLESVLYPPIITNQENTIDDRPDITDKPDEITEDKTSIEKLNFKGEDLEPYDGTDVEFLEAFELFQADYEQAPYEKISDLPEAVKKYSKKAQKVFLTVFNEILKTKKDEKMAFRIAWKALKNSLKGK